ncbi:hypothetical protein RJT34_15253 [Clitoria ternatea]|uniref:Phytocyanin domain-containing protein n=1 Tax=Clitoria ternatea TaxID=43366 RepID=A0AAN9JTP5_CLITE
MERSKGLYLIGCLVVAIWIGGSEGREYRVGDTFGWASPPNRTFYSDWAASNNFSVGDVLIFNWTGDHSLAFGPDPIYYNNCNTTAPGNHTGSVDVTLLVSSNQNQTQFQITLPSGSSYYFCTISDHCVKGQKFSVHLQPSSAQATTPSGILYAFISSLRIHKGMKIILGKRTFHISFRPPVIVTVHSGVMS